MAPKNVMKELGKRWNDLSDKQKGKYDELATKDRKRYEKEMKTWNKTQKTAST